MLAAQTGQLMHSLFKPTAARSIGKAMSTYPDGEAAAIKGSWENRLQEAQQLAASFNDKALPLYEKLYTRLSKMPVAQRKAAGERLQNIFLQTAVDYQGYLTLRGQYDEALIVIDRLREETGADENQMWQSHAANVLIMAGRNDEAIDRIRQAGIMAGLDELEAMGDIAMIHLRLGDTKASASTLAEMAALVESADLSDDARARDRALVANLTGTLTLEQGDFEQAAALFEEAIALDPNYKQQLYRIYSRMIRLGDPARAIAFVKRDQRNPIRTGFWHGVALDQLGESDEAIKHWQKVVNVDLAANEEPHLLEYILAHYYLGDAEGTGLGLVLNALQEETGGQWALFLLAGVGWALRGNVENARTNFFTGMNQRRANGNGLLLPWESWNFLLDLLPEEELANYAEFFETEHEFAAETDDSGEDGA